MNEQRLKEFLDALSELTRRHGFKIAGCGCCGSPWIDEIEDASERDGAYEISGPSAEHLKWVWNQSAPQ